MTIQEVVRMALTQPNDRMTSKMPVTAGFLCRRQVRDLLNLTQLMSGDELELEYVEIKSWFESTFMIKMNGTGGAIAAVLKQIIWLSEQ